MTQFYYSGQYMVKRAKRSANVYQQFSHHMPPAEAVLVSGRAAAGWSLSTWRQIAETRKESLRKDLLIAIGELQQEEAELAKKYGARRGSK